MIRISELLGARFTHPGESSAFEGPLGGAKTKINEVEVVGMISSLADAFGDARRIGILSNHQIETYLCVLATAATGRTFVPLNPKFPVARLNQVAELAGVDIIAHDFSSVEVLEQITSQARILNITEIINGASSRNVESMLETVQNLKVNIDDTAYIMFTSGSTGVPKGVPVSFGNLHSYVQGITEAIEFPTASRCTQFFDLSFDLSVHDIFVTNAIRGTLIAPSLIDAMMPSAHLARENINVWFSVPLLGATLVSSQRKEEYRGLDRMLFCGEALPMEVVGECREWLTDNGQIWNLYGPTEATIAFTACDVTHAQRVTGSASIGMPFGGNITALLSDQDEVVTDPMLGDQGELLLGGPQVFAGYSTDAPSPFVFKQGVRFYRSGDLVRMEDDGIYFRGRADSQVKFRGYRIELSEIETAMRRVFGVNTVAVVLAGSQKSAKLVAFHLQNELPNPPNASLLGDVLPNYMIPSAIIALEEMPTNQNGKIDRRALVSMAG